MLSRFALAGLTLAGLAATANAEPAWSGVSKVQAEAAGGRATIRRVRGQRSSSRAPIRRQDGIDAVLPPLRPALEPAQVGVTAATAPAAVAMDERTSAALTAAAVDVLPPFRPSLPAEAAVAAEPVEVTPIVSVARVIPPARPAFRWDAEVATAAAPEPAPAPMPALSAFGGLFGAPAAMPFSAPPSLSSGRAHLDERIAHHARLNGVPEDLVHRIVVRESRYNPRAVGRGGAMGLMQIKTGTARALGYQGGPAGLLDAETNLTYAVKYLAGAYRVAGGNHARAVGHYARGYYYEARRQGLTRTVERLEGSEAPAPAVAPAAPTTQPVPAGFRPDENR